MDIKDIDWGITKQNLQSKLKEVTSNEEYLYGKCFFWGTECFANFQFSSNRIKCIEVSFFKPNGPGTEAIEFKKVFDILKNMLGEPDSYENITLAKLMQLNNVHTELKLKELPKITWTRGGNLIVHRFRDKWGIIPDTYVEKSS